MEEQTLGKMIAALRKSCGMTQAELAEIMGVTDKAVSKWERDLSRPDMDALPKLAETFHISVDELMLVKTAEAEEVKPHKKARQELAALICKCITVAMGVAVTVLSGLGAIETDTAISLLGIGVAAAGICLLTK